MNKTQEKRVKQVVSSFVEAYKNGFFEHQDEKCDDRQCFCGLDMMINDAIIVERMTNASINEEFNFFIEYRVLFGVKDDDIEAGWKSAERIMGDIPTNSDGAAGKVIKREDLERFVEGYPNMDSYDIMDAITVDVMMKRAQIRTDDFDHLTEYVRTWAGSRESFLTKIADKMSDEFIAHYYNKE